MVREDSASPGAPADESRAHRGTLACMAGKVISAKGKADDGTLGRQALGLGSGAGQHIPSGSTFSSRSHGS